MIKFQMHDQTLPHKKVIDNSISYSAKKQCTVLKYSSQISNNVVFSISWKIYNIQQ